MRVDIGPREKPRTVKVGVADYAVAGRGVTFATSGLGSCVGVALYDRRASAYGLAHVMLPSSEEGTGDDEGKFADTAIAAMLAEMEARGARPASVRAKLAGGANVQEFRSLETAIGVRNVEAVEAALSEHGVAVAAADLGGHHGRSLRFESDTASLRVRSATREVIEL